MDEYAYNKIFVGGLHYDTRDGKSESVVHIYLFLLFFVLLLKYFILCRTPALALLSLLLFSAIFLYCVIISFFILIFITFELFCMHISFIFHFFCLFIWYRSLTRLLFNIICSLFSRSLCQCSIDSFPSFCFYSSVTVCHFFLLPSLS